MAAAEQRAPDHRAAQGSDGRARDRSAPARSWTRIGTSSTGEVRAGTMTVKLVPEGKRKLSQREFELLIAPELRDDSRACACASAAARPARRFERDPGQRQPGRRSTRRPRRSSATCAPSPASATRRPPRACSRPEIADPARLEPRRRPRRDGGRHRHHGARRHDRRHLDAAAEVQPRGPQHADPHADSQLAARGRPRRAEAAARADGRRQQRAARHGGELEMGSGPAQITRFDRRRSVTIKADIAGAPLGDVDRGDRSSCRRSRQLPADVKQMPYGDSERMNELFGEFGDRASSPACCSSTACWCCCSTTSRSR